MFKMCPFIPCTESRWVRESSERWWGCRRDRRHDTVHWAAQKRQGAWETTCVDVLKVPVLRFKLCQISMGCGMGAGMAQCCGVRSSRATPSGTGDDVKWVGYTGRRWARYRRKVEGGSNGRSTRQERHGV
jgi:hypothetical protein